MAKFMSFEDAIEAHLNKLAETDELFAKTYAKKNKSVKECCKYIMSEAKKAAKGGVSVALSDEDVYNLAVHYYDEDDITATDEVAGEVVVAAKAEKPSKPKTAKGKKAEAVKVEPQVTPQPEPEITVEADEEAEENYELEIPIF